MLAWRPLLWAAGIAAVLLLVLVRTMDAPNAVLARRAIRFDQTAPAGTTLTSGGVLSPDGRYLAFIARHGNDGKTRLWVRPLESARARVLAGTEGAFRPFWSPDGQALAFFAGGRLRRINVAGGPAQALATVGYRPSGGTWSSNGLILYSDRMSPIYAVPASGTSQVKAVTTFDAARQEIAPLRAAVPARRRATSCSTPTAPTPITAAPISARSTNRRRSACWTARTPP